MPKTTKTKATRAMNERLLRQVQNSILQHPDRTDMKDWCRTTYCIGGRAALLAGWIRPRARSLWELKAWKPVARPTADPDVKWQVTGETPQYSGVEGSPEPLTRLLRLTPKQGERLFYLKHWPVDFIQKYNATPAGSYQRAGVMADRIEHFIASKGRE